MDDMTIPDTISGTLTAWLKVLHGELARKTRSMDAGVVHFEDISSYQQTIAALEWAIEYGEQMAETPDLDRLFTPEEFTETWGIAVRDQFPDVNRVRFPDYLQYNNLEFYYTVERSLARMHQQMEEDRKAAHE